MRTFVRHARQFVPLIFIAHEPQMPSLLHPQYQKRAYCNQATTGGGSYWTVKSSKSQRMLAGDTSYTPARSPERQSWVLLILDLEEHVQHHRPATAQQDTIASSLGDNKFNL